MKILIIEDQEKLCKLLKLGLEREGYAVDFMLDGEAGQRRIEVHHQDYDLIILDLMLPKLSGEEVCQSIRKMGITTPVLVLTAKSGTEDKVSLLNIGADDYLVKPFSFQELLARIKALMRRPKQALPEKLKIGELVLDPVSRRVFIKGKEVELTLKEFSLLEHLMRHPDQVVSRQELLDKLWDFNFEGFSNVVDVHINNLRKKVNKDKVIETVWGVGYKIRT